MAGFDNFIFAGGGYQKYRFFPRVTWIILPGDYSDDNNGFGHYKVPLNNAGGGPVNVSLVEHSAKRENAAKIYFI